MIVLQIMRGIQEDELETVGLARPAVCSGLNVTPQVIAAMIARRQDALDKNYLKRHQTYSQMQGENRKAWLIFSRNDEEERTGDAVLQQFKGNSACFCVGDWSNYRKGRTVTHVTNQFVCLCLCQGKERMAGP